MVKNYSKCKREYNLSINLIESLCTIKILCLPKELDSILEYSIKLIDWETIWICLK